MANAISATHSSKGHRRSFELWTAFGAGLLALLLALLPGSPPPGVAQAQSTAGFALPSDRELPTGTTVMITEVSAKDAWYDTRNSIVGQIGVVIEERLKKWDDGYWYGTVSIGGKRYVFHEVKILAQGQGTSSDNQGVTSSNQATPTTTPAAERWAAIDPNNEGSSPVVWDSTKAGARQKAIDACKRLSKTCAGAPAHTDQIGDTFAYMCCTRPRFGCAIGVGERREDAIAMVRKTFSDAGYSQCSLRAYVSANSGQKVK